MGQVQVHVGRTAAERAAELGYPVDVVERAVIYSETMRAAVNPLTPMTYPATTGWASAYAGLLDLLIPTGCRRGSYGGLPVVVSPDGSRLLTVWTGDKNTGICGAEQPRTTGTRGTMVRQALTRNANQEWLLETVPGWTKADLERIGPELWALLIRHDGAKAFFEISRPRSIDASAHIYDWFERILLGPIDMDRGTNVSKADDQPDIDVDVNRKTGA